MINRVLQTGQEFKYLFENCSYWVGHLLKGGSPNKKLLPIFK